MHMLKLSLSIVLLTAILGLSIACSKKPNDDAIAKDIQTKVAADPDTKDSDVIVAAKDGKVTLSGKVKTPAAQKKVEQIARKEPGAAGVDDQTAVEAGAMAMSEEGAMPEQATQPVPPPAPVEKPKPQPIVVPAKTETACKVRSPFRGLSNSLSDCRETLLTRPGAAEGESPLMLQGYPPDAP
jgi:BON domain